MQVSSYPCVIDPEDVICTKKKNHQSLLVIVMVESEMNVVSCCSHQQHQCLDFDSDDNSQLDCQTVSKSPSNIPFRTNQPKAGNPS